MLRAGKGRVVLNFHDYPQLAKGMKTGLFSPGPEDIFMLNKESHFTEMREAADGLYRENTSEAGEK